MAKIPAYCQYCQFQRNQTVMVTNIPQLGVVSNHQRDGSISPNDDQHQQRSACSSSHQHTLMTPINTDEREVHVYAHPQEHSDDQAQESEEEVMLQIHLDVQSVMWWIHCAAHPFSFHASCSAHCNNLTEVFLFCLF